MDGGISFLDEETDEIVASLEAPNINDATGKAYSEELYYDIEPDGEEDSYLLTLHLDEDYFQEKDREYPVTIDPTVSWTGSTNFWDVYVINGSYKNTNFYDSGITAMMASGLVMVSRSAAIVSAGAVLRPTGSSMIDASLPMTRNCSAVVNRWSSPHTTTICFATG